MRLTAQQKMTALIFGILILLAFGAMTFINSTSVDGEEIALPIFSTSTLPADASSSGWWENIPTDPALPSMPGYDKATATAVQIPISSPTGTH